MICRFFSFFSLLFVGVLPVLAEPLQPVISEIVFQGNSTLSKRELRRLVSIPPGSVWSDSAIVEANARVLQNYKSVGHYRPALKVARVLRPGSSQVLLQYLIQEGYQSKVAEIRLEKETPKEIRKLYEKFSKRFIGSPASGERMKQLIREFTVELRHAGFLQASVRILEVDYLEASGDVAVGLRVNPRLKMEIEFSGNEHLSREELLSPLRIDSRRVPFTGAALGGFCRRIVELYQQEGFFEAECELEETADPSGERRFHFAINENQQYRFRSIRFQGNESFPAKLLKPVVTSRSARFYLLRRWWPGFISTSQMERDAAALQEFYRAEGFRKAKVRYRVERGENKEHLYLVFVIEEGAARRISNTQIIWKDILQAGPASNASQKQAIGKLLAIQPTLLGAGSRYQSLLVEDQRILILEQVEELGFPLAVVEARFDVESRTLNYVVTPGIHVRVGHLQLEGNLFTREEIIRRYLELNSADVWDPERIRQSEQALYQMGIFQSVSVRPLDGKIDSETEDIQVAVRERDTLSTDFLFGYGNDDGFRMSAELSQRNLWGRNDKLSLSAEGLFDLEGSVLDLGRFRALFNRPRIGSSRVGFIGELFAQTDIEFTEQFSYDRFGGATLFRMPISPELSTAVGLSTFSEYLFDVEPDVVIGEHDTGSTFYNIPRLELEYDARDDPFNPREGYRGVALFKVSADTFGSDVNFASVASQNSYLLPVSTRLTWANNIRLEYLYPFGDTDVVPLNNRLFLGGRRSLRGFSRYSVGPRGVDGNVLGGDFAANLNSELWFQVTQEISVVGFLDAGQAFLLEEGDYQGKSLDLSDMRYSPGFGVRYKTPIGPVSVEYGFALNRDFGEAPGRLNFEIGTAF